MEALKVAGLTVGAIVFAISLLNVAVPVKSCTELKLMYEPLIGIDCRAE